MDCTRTRPQHSTPPPSLSAQGAPVSSSRLALYQESPLPQRCSHLPGQGLAQHQTVHRPPQESGGLRKHSRGESQYRVLVCVICYSIDFLRTTATPMCTAQAMCLFHLQTTTVPVSTGPARSSPTPCEGRITLRIRNQSHTPETQDASLSLVLASSNEVLGTDPRPSHSVPWKAGLGTLALDAPGTFQDCGSRQGSQRLCGLGLST
jgi:hypothetical protein